MIMLQLTKSNICKFFTSHTIIGTGIIFKDKGIWNCGTKVSSEQHVQDFWL